MRPRRLSAVSGGYLQIVEAFRLPPGVDPLAAGAASTNSLVADVEVFDASWPVHEEEAKKNAAEAERKRKEALAEEDRRRAACKYIDIVAFGGIPHDHDGHGCHAATPADHTHGGITGEEIVLRGTELVFEATGQVICSAVGGGAATKGLNLLIKGGSKVAKWATGILVEGYVTNPCDVMWDRYQEHIKKTVLDPERDGTDDGDGADGEQTTPTTAPPTTAPPSASPTPDGDDADSDENSAGNYCGPWTASAFGGRPDRGGVTLFVNGAAHTQYQSSYRNRHWAIARCQAVLASLGQ